MSPEAMMGAVTPLSPEQRGRSDGSSKWTVSEQTLSHMIIMNRGRIRAHGIPPPPGMTPGVTPHGTDTGIASWNLNSGELKKFIL